MPTTNLGLATPATGTEVDTWGDVLNANAGIIDSAFGTVTAKALTNINVTLTATEAQASILRFSGTLTGNVAINVSAIKKFWMIDNLTTGNFVVTITGGSGNVVGVPQGEIVQVLWDGTNCKFINLGRVGEYLDLPVTSVPSWITACTVPPYLLTDGSTFNAGTYPYLNTMLGGNTLPDFRGRMAAFLNGGTNRITTAGSGIDGDTRFSAGGGQTNPIIQANLPNVNFSVTNNLTYDKSTTQTVAKPGSPNDTNVTLPLGYATTAVAGTLTVSSGGSGTGMATMPPTAIAGIRMMRAA